MSAVDYRFVPLSLILPLRSAVFFPDKPVQAGRVKADDVARHVAAFGPDGQTLAVASLYPQADGSERLRFLATRVDSRGQGVASGLLRFLLLRRSSADPAICLHAETPLTAFYERAGFVAEAATYERHARRYRRFRSPPTIAGLTS